MDPRPDALARTHLHLTLLTRGRETRTVQHWRRDCPGLAGAPIETPDDLKGWLRSLPTSDADAVLGELVGMAQGSVSRSPTARGFDTPRPDPTALLAVICCLEPGIRTLAKRAQVGIDEAVSEVALGILDFPHERRRSIAAGLLLDARNRIWRQQQREARNQPLDASTPGPADAEVGADQQLVDLVAEARRQGVLNHLDAQLILHTRIAGHHVKGLASHLGLSASAAYQRRHRAEARLATLVA